MNQLRFEGIGCRNTQERALDSNQNRSRLEGGAALQCCMCGALYSVILSAAGRTRGRRPGRGCSSHNLAYRAPFAMLWVMEDAARQQVALRGRRLEYFTIGWNLLEGLVAVIAGMIAASISLVGFGIDSFIEVTSGGALLWRMSVDADSENRERNEGLSLRIVGFCFLALAAYVTVESVSDLWNRKVPDHSIAGIVLASASLIVMPLLSRAKKRVGADLGSRAMNADAKQTDFCFYLSAILLVGLLVNATLGWWWADPVSALVMVPIILKEGLQNIRGEACARD